MMETTYSIGVDIGGTFTDCVVRSSSGSVVVDKAFTTPNDLTDGVLAALVNAAAQTGIDVTALLGRATAFRIGTTSPVNRLINRAGARVGLLTTSGHEDAILIGRVRQKTDGLSSLERNDIRAWGKAQPIVPPALIRGIDERVGSSGEVVVPLAEEAAAEAIAELVAAGCEAFAVCLLWSFLNPSHEQRVGDLILQQMPAAFVTLSSEIAPLMGEYERCATTVLNSYLGPGTFADLRTLVERLTAGGLDSDVLVMGSTGGVMPYEQARRRPVYLLSSGPVGGVAAARGLAERPQDYGTGTNLITTDMGGTSFDVGVIVASEPVETPISYHNRYPVLMSAVEVTSIGAGGGSIASIDPVTGVLAVGPQSAGSVPGPVCYRHGGTEPTVTDANLVVGRLNPQRFFAGRHALDVEAARSAIEERLAKPLGVSPEEAAEAVLAIVESQMADLIRSLTVKRGHDPRSFSIVAYGGGGPLHTAAYAAELGVPLVVIPQASSTFSAWGVAHSPVVYHTALSFPALLTEDESASLPWPWRDMDRTTESNETADAETQYFIDMRYRYQPNELRVPVDVEEVDRSAAQNELMSRFERLYEKRFGRGTSLRSAGIEITTYRRVTTINFEWADAEVSISPQSRGDTSRKVFIGGQWQELRVHDADRFSLGKVEEGPCMVEGDLMTVFVAAGQRLERMATGDFLLMTQHAGADAVDGGRS